MARIEISRLRKDHGMSQSELAQHLQITQSFLSAIENGKSPLPPEKEERLLEIFNLKDLHEYTVENAASDNSRKVAEMTDSDLFNQLLNRFHQQAHSKEDSHHHHHDHHERIEYLQTQLEAMMERNDRLMNRNESLSDTNDKLREEVDQLRKEVFTLKKRILDSGIDL